MKYQPATGTYEDWSHQVKKAIKDKMAERVFSVMGLTFSLFCIFFTLY